MVSHVATYIFVTYFISLILFYTLEFREPKGPVKELLFWILLLHVAFLMNPIVEHLNVWSDDLRRIVFQTLRFVIFIRIFFTLKKIISRCTLCLRR